jgi:hypothetical protein
MAPEAPETPTDGRGGLLGFPEPPGPGSKKLKTHTCCGALFSDPVTESASGLFQVRGERPTDSHFDERREEARAALQHGIGK